MISYAPLWETCKKKNKTERDLMDNCHFCRETINRLKTNRNIRTSTIDRLCNYLHCDINDVVMVTPEPELLEKKVNKKKKTK